MPPKTGAMRTTVSTISSTSFVSRQIGNASMSANCLKSIALAFHHRAARRADRCRPDPSTAVPSVTTATVLRLIVSWKALLGIGGDRHRDARDAGRVDHRKILPRLDRDLRLDANLAAEVREEGRVGDADDAHALDAASTALRTSSADRIRRDVDRHVAHDVRSCRPSACRPRRSMPPASPIALASMPNAPGCVRHLEAHDERVTYRW